MAHRNNYLEQSQYPPRLNGITQSSISSNNSHQFYLRQSTVSADSVFVRGPEIHSISSGRYVHDRNFLPHERGFGPFGSRDLPKQVAFTPLALNRGDFRQIWEERPRVEQRRQEKQRRQEEQQRRQQMQHFYGYIGYLLSLLRRKRREEEESAKARGMLQRNNLKDFTRQDRMAGGGPSARPEALHGYTRRSKSPENMTIPELVQLLASYGVS